jgi:hypothetical protein
MESSLATFRKFTFFLRLRFRDFHFPHDFSFSTTPLLYPACSLFMFQSVKGSVSKFLKAVRGKYVSVADCTGSTSAGCKTCHKLQ